MSEMKNLPGRAHELTPKYVGEMTIAKVIVVPGRIVNVVLKK